MEQEEHIRKLHVSESVPTQAVASVFRERLRQKVRNFQTKVSNYETDENCKSWLLLHNHKPPCPPRLTLIHKKQPRAQVLVPDGTVKFTKSRPRHTEKNLRP